MASPKKQAAPSLPPSSTPAHAAVDSKPVVEAADPTPTPPGTKVVPTAIPTPDSVVTLSNHDTSQSDMSTRETLQSDNSQPLAAEPTAEPVICQQVALIAEHVPESVCAIAAAESQQSSSEKHAEDHPQPDADPVSAAQSSEQPPPVETQMQNQLSTGLDKTTVPAEGKMKPNPRITQSETAAFLTDFEKVELTSDQGISDKPHPIPAPTSADKSAVELDKQTEQTQVGQEVQAADQTPSDSVGTASNAEQTDTIQNTESDTPADKNTVSELRKADAAITEDTPHYTDAIVENVSPVVPVHTESTLLDMANVSHPVALVEVKSDSHDKADIEITMWNKDFTKETAKKNIPAKAVEETIGGTTEGKNNKGIVVGKETFEEEKTSAKGESFEDERVQNSAGTDGVKADDGKAFEGEETAQKTVEKASDQNAQGQESNKAELSPGPSFTEGGKVLITDRKESESAPTFTEEIPKEETQIHKERRTNEEGLLLNMLEEEGKLIAGARTTTVLKVNNEAETAVSDPPPPEQQEKVTVKALVQGVEMVSASVRDNACKEKISQDDTQVASPNTDSITEDQHGVEKSITDGGEKQVKETAELPVKENEELDKKDDESQIVAGSTKETISASEMSTVPDNDGAGQFHVEGHLVLKTDDVSDTAFKTRDASESVASLPVAKPRISVDTVNEQDRKPRDINATEAEDKEAKVQPLGKSSEDAATEVTILTSSHRVRLY